MNIRTVDGKCFRLTEDALRSPRFILLGPDGTQWGTDIILGCHAGANFRLLEDDGSVCLSTQILAITD